MDTDNQCGGLRKGGIRFLMGTFKKGKNKGLRFIQFKRKGRKHPLKKGQRITIKLLQRLSGKKPQPKEINVKVRLSRNKKGDIIVHISRKKFILEKGVQFTKKLLRQLLKQALPKTKKRRRIKIKSKGVPKAGISVGTTKAKKDEKGKEQALFNPSSAFGSIFSLLGSQLRLLQDRSQRNVRSVEQNEAKIVKEVLKQLQEEGKVGAPPEEAPRITKRAVVPDTEAKRIFLDAIRLNTKRKDTRIGKQIRRKFNINKLREDLKKVLGVDKISEKILQRPTMLNMAALLYSRSPEFRNTVAKLINQAPTSDIQQVKDKSEKFVKPPIVTKERTELDKLREQVEKDKKLIIRDLPPRSLERQITNINKLIDSQNESTSDLAHMTLLRNERRRRAELERRQIEEQEMAPTDIEPTEDISPLMTEELTPELTPSGKALIDEIRTLSAKKRIGRLQKKRLAKALKEATDKGINIDDIFPEQEFEEFEPAPLTPTPIEPSPLQRELAKPRTVQEELQLTPPTLRPTPPRQPAIPAPRTDPLRGISPTALQEQARRLRKSKPKPKPEPTPQVPTGLLAELQRRRQAIAPEEDDEDFGEGLYGGLLRIDQLKDELREARNRHLNIQDKLASLLNIGVSMDDSRVKKLFEKLIRAEGDVERIERKLEGLDFKGGQIDPKKKERERELRKIREMPTADIVERIRRLESIGLFAREEPHVRDLLNELNRRIRKQTEEKKGGILGTRKEIFQRRKLTALRRKELFGKGKDIRDRALSTSEINSIMEYHGNGFPFLGAHPRDLFLKTLKPFIKKHNLKRYQFILNTDKSNGTGGIHWLAVHYDETKKDMPRLEVYDSFARPLRQIEGGKQILEDLKKLVGNKLVLFKENRVRQQTINGYNCGYFCLSFLLKRQRGHPFDKVTGFQKFVKKRLSDIGNSEEDIERFKKSIPPFHFL